MYFTFFFPCVRSLQLFVIDRPGMELCSGNSVALLAAPERLFASSDAKRARLHEHVLAALNESECSKQPQWLSRRF